MLREIDSVFDSHHILVTSYKFNLEVTHNSICGFTVFYVDAVAF